MFVVRSKPFFLETFFSLYANVQSVHCTHRSMEIGVAKKAHNPNKKEINIQMMSTNERSEDTLFGVLCMLY